MKKIILAFALLILNLIFWSELCSAQVWSPLGSGANDNVRTFTVFNNELIVGGDFTTIGGVSAIYIAKWNGTSWVPLGSGCDI